MSILAHVFTTDTGENTLTYTPWNHGTYAALGRLDSDDQVHRQFALVSLMSICRSQLCGSATPPSNSASEGPMALDRFGNMLRGAGPSRSAAPGTAGTAKRPVARHEQLPL